ncbi:MAG: hypothetical protein AB7V46_16150 [Thermomicrobiales bacterium]
MENSDDDIRLILTALLDQARLQTRILREMQRNRDVDLCLLETIARIGCLTANETQRQTVELRAIRSSLEQLLEVFRLSHPDAALQYDNLAKLRAEIEACCPPVADIEPICVIEPCLSTGDWQRREGYSARSKAYVEPSKISKRPHPGWKIVDRPHHEDDDAMPVVRQGSINPLIAPSPGAALLNIQSGGAPTPGGQEPVTFRRFTGTALSAGWPPDMSGAKAGDVVLMSGNLWIKLSVDGGATFIDLDFTTLFAADTTYGGWAGDQVIHYIPSIDCFVLYVQSFKAASGTNMNKNVVKVALASPDDLKTYSGGREAWWRQWDLTSDTFGLGNAWMDFPDVSYGANYVHFNTNVFAGKTGKLFYELPLADMKAGKGLSFLFAFIEDGISIGSPIQNMANDDNYWAGHVDNSTMRIYSCQGGASTYSWRDRKVASWPITSDNNIVSAAPDFGDWISGDHRIIGATRRGNELWFGWSATTGDGGGGGFKFPHPHVRIAKFDLGNDFAPLDELQVWNPDLAFAYPSLITNSDNEVGISLAWGGGSNYGSHAVGILGDFVVWYGEASTETSLRQQTDAAGDPLTNPDGSPVLYSRWGDYVQVRLAQPDTRFFSAFGYAVLDDPAATPAERMNFHYVEFGRERRQFRPPG